MEFLESLELYTRKWEKHQTTIIVLLVVVIGGLTGFFAYRTYSTRLQEGASGAFVESMNYYNATVGQSSDDDATLSFVTAEEKWQKTAEVFQKAYADYSRAGISGVFLVYAADALDKLGKHAEAIALMEQGTRAISAPSLRDWYRAKTALMLLDAANQAKIDEGIALLMSLAQDPSGAAYDFALYQLGDYYWHLHDFDKVKSYWNTLDIAYRTTDKPSEWYTLAKPRLKLIQG